MRMVINGKTYVDQPGLADILNNTVKCLAAWRTRGYGPRYHRIGGKVWFDLDDVVAFINSTAVDPAA